jgi:hypothetical protein
MEEQIIVFWTIRPCTLVDICRLIGGMRCLNLQSRRLHGIIIHQNTVTCVVTVVKTSDLTWKNK